MGKLVRSYYVNHGKGPNVMYDIEVEDNHNYFAEGVLVHNCKSPVSSQGKNLLKLAKVGSRHIGMTGTLLINNPLDAYVPLKFINNENSTYTSFKSFYCNFENKFGHNQIVGFKNINHLKDQIAECSLRRSKDLLNLPPKIIVPEYIDMEDSQAKFYEDLHKGIVEEADRVEIKTSSLLGLVTRLRQAATCPSTLTSNEKITSCKLVRARELVEEIISNGEKVVIFSTFKEPLYSLYEMLSSYKPLIATGDFTDAEVSKSIDAFQQDDSKKIFLATTAKCGTGVTLTAASYEIFIDAPWTYSIFEQVCDRIYRIGTDKKVIIYNLIALNTIDERVNTLINRKKVLSDYLIDNKSTEDDDLRYLLGISS